MDNLISRQMAVDELTTPHGIMYPIRTIESLPSVDAVPVVRCRDCKHHHFDKDGIPYCDGIDYGYGWKDDEFCSRWERK